MGALLFLALLLAPGTLEQRVRDGLAALDRQDFPAAQRNFEEASRLDPKNANVWFLLAQAHLRQGHRDDALRAAGRAAQAAGGDANLLYNLALLDRDAGDVDGSIAMARRASATEKSPAVFALLGQGYAAKKDWRNAIPQFQQALRLSPDSAELLFELTQCYLQSRDFAAAAAALEKRRALVDKDPQLALALGVAYYGERRFEDAVGSYLRVTEIAPDIPQPYYFLSRILEHAQGRLPVVIERATAFEQRHPSSPLGFLLHAKALILELPATGFPPEAVRARALLETALTCDARQGEPHYLLAILLEREQKYPEAAAQLERSVALNPEDAAAHFRLARVYDRLGRTADAARERAVHERLSR
jgi:tetratricopeptide (TPR) repeat protein